MSIVDRILEIVRGLGLELEVRRVSCGELRGQRSEYVVPGVYVFVGGGGEVLYVGQSGNVYRRVYGEHCMAHIGGSEGVMRFLMLLLDRVCAGGFGGLDVRRREEFVKRVLREFIWGLDIYVLVGEGLVDRYLRGMLERELRRVLRPLLNPL